MIKDHFFNHLINLNKKQLKLLFFFFTFLVVYPTDLLFYKKIISAEPISSSNKKALLLTVNGTINPASADYIVRGIKEGNESKSELIIITLDTPGGLDTSMRLIIKEIMGSVVPVVVYVSPSGSRAASAGTFITLAAHVAAMAPGTNIGAAHPVNIEGQQMDKVMKEKMENDFAAYIISIAQKRARNAKWAEMAVRTSVALSEENAKKERVIDIVSKNLETLLTELDNWKVTTIKGEKRLDTKNIKVIKYEMTAKDKILDALSNPNLAYMLMLLGFYGLFFELSNPGAIFPGIIGSIALILAFYSLSTLPINFAGFLLIVLALILFLLEIKVVSHGALTIGGIIALIFGSIMLIDSPDPYIKISIAIIIPAALATAMFFFFLVGAGVKAQKSHVKTGAEGLIGMEGIALFSEDGTPRVFVHGEYWLADFETQIVKGTKVVITGINGLRLTARAKLET